MVGPQE
jgi:hypothetical protein